MRVICTPEPGVIELSWTWPPTFVGMNSLLKQEIESLVAPKFIGRPASDDVLDEAHDMIIDYIVKKFPFPGLRDYLDAIKFVSDRPLAVVPG